MSSASRCSEELVNPTRSTKRTETRRRSATGAIPAAVDARTTGAAATAPTAVISPAVSALDRGFPHSPQNLAPGSFAAPHVGQAVDSRAPHSKQNFRASSFAVPQLAQVSTGLGPRSAVEIAFGGAAYGSALPSAHA